MGVGWCRRYKLSCEDHALKAVIELGLLLFFKDKVTGRQLVEMRGGQRIAEIWRTSEDGLRKGASRLEAPKVKK